MSIGSGIFLFVVGAVLAFAITVEVTWINLTMVGYLLMAAGVIIFLLGLILMYRKRQSVTTVQSGVDANGAAVTERRTSSTPPSDVV
ncbi:Flp pilus assembly protein TadB [Leifsonia sp. AK011]|uniref:DUF6458 family protein n=1 Tax=Leifsonia sp. AK011 TaxID=2723075 RepID=UPI0015C766F1|nr:DUF6458 family protein [Leifsonia sp. AK011]NYF11372.1 Flp pilus assembly protein TadB [Leifsonia sp. AK011]